LFVFLGCQRGAKNDNTPEKKHLKWRSAEHKKKGAKNAPVVVLSVEKM
jgi:hypothetical protein